MCFNKLSIGERTERARVIINTGYIIPSFTQKYLKRHLQEAKEQVYSKLSDTSRLTNFLGAALLIRKNYTQWKAWLKNPSKSAPKVFKSFSNNKILVFYLFLGDYLSVFHLEPLFSFIEGEEYNPRSLLIRGKKDNIFSNVKYVVSMWESMGSPWEDSRCGKDLTNMAKVLKKPLISDEESEDLCIAWHFWEFSTEFQFYWNLYSQDESEESVTKILFDIDEFVKDAALAVAFDRSGVNTLEIIHELFPDIPEMVPRIIKRYSDYRDMVPRKKSQRYKLKCTVLEENFKCDMALLGEDVPNCGEFMNQSILQMFKKYPEVPYRVANNCDTLDNFFSEKSDEIDRLMAKILRTESNFYERDYTQYTYINREGNIPYFDVNTSHHKCKQEMQKLKMPVNPRAKNRKLRAGISNKI